MRRNRTTAIAVSSALLALSQGAPVYAASPLAAERIVIERGARPQAPNASCDFDRALIAGRRGRPSEREERVEEAVDARAPAHHRTHPIAANWPGSIRSPSAPSIEAP